MDNRPLTPREKIEARREAKRFLRLCLKHYDRNCEVIVWALICEWMAIVTFWAIKGHLKDITQLLKALVLIPKFCNGLIGVSLTDSLPALASN